MMCKTILRKLFGKAVAKQQEFITQYLVFKRLVLIRLTPIYFRVLMAFLLLKLRIHKPPFADAISTAVSSSNLMSIETTISRSTILASATCLAILNSAQMEPMGTSTSFQDQSTPTKSPWIFILPSELEPIEKG